MNTFLRNGLVLGFLGVVAIYGGCSDDEELPVDDGGTGATMMTTTTTSPSTPSSTGSLTTTTTTGGGGGNAFQGTPGTNEGCTGGAACDINAMETGFECFAANVSTEAICAACNNSMGPWCQPGLTCYSGENFCRKWCCTDADCGPT